MGLSDYRVLVIQGRLAQITGFHSLINALQEAGVGVIFDRTFTLSF